MEYRALSEHTHVDYLKGPEERLATNGSPRLQTLAGLHASLTPSLGAVQ